MSLPAGVTEQRGAGFQNVFDAAVEEATLERVWMSVGRDVEQAKVTDKVGRVRRREITDPTPGARRRDKVQEMVRRGAVAANRIERRTSHVFMVLEPPLADFGDRRGLEAERGGAARFELGVDLGRGPPGGFPVDPDARLAPSALLLVTQIPGSPPQVTPTAPLGARISQVVSCRMASLRCASAERPAVHTDSASAAP